MINHFISIIKKIKQKTPDVKTNRGLNKSLKKKQITYCFYGIQP